ncbi:hypothetical protein [Thermococcus sp. JCM 11816]|uniref:hypothetical protein n=1 Tax=Thermococcus sp. (strain JCM 11816 / KS-1) TaxID=1295125 RepID=UPI003465AEF0
MYRSGKHNWDRYNSQRNDSTHDNQGTPPNDNYNAQRDHHEHSNGDEPSATGRPMRRSLMG